MGKRTGINVIPIPSLQDLRELPFVDLDAPRASTITPEDVLDAQRMAFGSRDGLTEDEIRYLRKRVRKLAKSLRKQYELLGRATGETRQVDCLINLVERTVKMEFKRVAMGKHLTEAVLEADISIIRPRTQKQLQAEGIVAKRDPLEPERVVTLTGKIHRPFPPKDHNWHELPLDSFRLAKIPTAGTSLFNRMLEDGFLYHPRITNYLPFRDGDTPLEPMGRRDRRALEKKPLQELEAPQRKFVRDQFGRFVKNLRTRYDHVFQHISYDIDTVDKTFSLTLSVSDAFRAQGSPNIMIQGEFDLTWRNKGASGTALELRVTDGLSRQFRDAVRMTAPINIVGHRIETDENGKTREKRNGKRAVASDMLFNILAMSGKIGVGNHEAAREAKKARRIERPSRSERRARTKSERRAGNMSTSGLARFSAR